MSSIFSKLSTAKMFEKSAYFQEGLYITRIDGVKFVNGHKGESVVIECNVLATDSQHENAPTAGKTAAQVFSLNGDKREIGLGNLVQFLCAALDCEQSDHDDEAWEEIANDAFEGGLNGTEMFLEVFTIKTQSGNPFTKHVWKRQATDKDKASLGL